jgi:hypothetical protein
MTPSRWRALVVVLMIAGLLLAIRPLSGRVNPETLFPHADWGAHALFFALLRLLSLRAGFRADWPLAWALMGYGVGIEAAQYFAATGRSASLSDLGADAVGIALAWWFTRRSVRPQPQEHRG